MDKIFDRRNMGIPANLLVFFSYLLGYSFVRNLNTLIFAILFSVLVFVAEFDLKVKVAIIQSYVLGFFFVLCFGLLDAMNYLQQMNTILLFVKPPAFAEFIQLASAALHVLVILVYIVFLISTFFMREIRLSLVLNLFDRGRKSVPVPLPVNLVEPTQKPSPAIMVDTPVKEKTQNEAKGRRTVKINHEGKKQQYTKTNKLFPPNQQQYPKMPPVIPPAKAGAINKEAILRVEPLMEVVEDSMELEEQSSLETEEQEDMIMDQDLSSSVVDEMNESDGA